MARMARAQLAQHGKRRLSRPGIANTVEVGRKIWLGNHLLSLYDQPIRNQYGADVTKAPKPGYSLTQIPRGVWVLGFVSMLMDVSSEMIHALLPVYLVTVLGTSMVTVGFIEGIAEATASITKIFSGALSDWLGKRKLLAATGYGLAAFTKPVFPLAPTVSWLFAARFVDRIGQGIRGAPRDALIADIAPVRLRGARFRLPPSPHDGG